MLQTQIIEGIFTASRLLVMTTRGGGCRFKYSSFRLQRFRLWRQFACNDAFSSVPTELLSF